jgi:hypothetical protein
VGYNTALLPFEASVLPFLTAARVLRETRHLPQFQFQFQFQNPTPKRPATD